MPDEHMTWPPKGLPAVRMAIGNNKGGVGKSTLALYLGLLLGASGDRVLLVDADPSGQLSRWRQRAGDSWPSHVHVRRWDDPQELADRLRDTQGEYRHVLIDTPPNGQTTLRVALRLVTRLLIPVGDDPAEVSELGPTLRDVAEVGATQHTDAAIVLTRVTRASNDRHDARRMLQRGSLPLLDVEIPRWKAYTAAAAGVLPTTPDDFGHYLLLLHELTRDED